jgi:hypothetical protein
MTGYTVHTGSNDKFRSGWDKIFKSAKRAPAKSKPAAGKDAGSSRKSAKQK